MRPWGTTYIDCANDDQVELEHNDISSDIVRHRLTSIAKVGVSEPGRESRTGLYGSDMVCLEWGQLCLWPWVGPGLGSNALCLQRVEGARDTVTGPLSYLIVRDIPYLPLVH